MNTRQQPARPILEVRNLSLRFDNREQTAVDRVSFSIGAGSTLGLAGESGAGKSSIARAILGLIKADSGEILFNGENIPDMDSQALRLVRQRIQIVFQEPSASLSPRRTVQQTMLEPLDHFAIGDKDYRHKRVREVLATIGLEQDVLQRYPHQFSSGQQQRIAIARAMVTNPDLLIADEAVSALDVSVQAQFLQLIQSLQEDHGITFLFISHDLAVIRQIASEVAVMYRGQILEHSDADQFFGQPSHPYSRSLLAFASNGNRVRPREEKWQLVSKRSRDKSANGCVFVENCDRRMPVCDHIEPANIHVQQKNRDDPGMHCVKCHLYNEPDANETC